VRTSHRLLEEDGVIRRLLILATATAALSAGALTPAAHADAGPVPSSMAALGDSITQAFDSCGWWTECPENSWSTGTTDVNSHYSRLLALNPAINGHAYNDSVSGSKASDMNGQAQQAVSQGAQYVTMMIGANDACTSTASAMTPVSTFRSQVDTALNTLKAGLPNAKLLVVSVPNIYHLWDINKGNWVARVYWNLGSICQSMLASPTSTASADVTRRQQVLQRVVDFNTQLQQACAAYGSNCKTDNNAVFNYSFTTGQVSGWDYFHPSTSGQRQLSALTWAAGWGW
jgi:lysophospholipase L1-like esterase